MISLIWAMDENWLIGKDNVLPWHYPKDLAYFKSKTKNQTVLMGDMTYESLKGYYKDKPLPFGKIYVANLVDKAYPDAHLVKDMHQFLRETKEDVMVIGGKTIYQLALPYAQRLYITLCFRQTSMEMFILLPLIYQSLKLIEKTMEDGLIFAVYERISS
ncbi:MAG: dihydrofolate reductase [Acholeplasmataceae bacterium]|nr:dihydrofolate reductase [Acholeplasmataceae bacterium]